MKIFAGIVAWVIIVCYIISAIAFFTDSWGAIGFFGAILTMPFSIGFYVLLGLVGNFFVNFFWLALTIGCLVYAAKE